MRALARTRTVLLEPMTGCLQRQDVASGAKTGDLSERNICQVRLPAKGLAAMNIGQVDLNGWYAHSQNRITESNTGMGVSPRVDDEQRRLCPMLLNIID